MTREAGARLLGRTLVTIASLSLLAYMWATVARLDLRYWPSIGILLLISFGAAGLAVWRPLWATYLVFLCIPLFGNHPGGRFMEAINIPLAAATIGLVVSARRQKLEAPHGVVWAAVAFYLFSIALAFIAAVPGVLTQSMTIGQPTAALAEALTAPENNPLYSAGSVVMVALAAGWAIALTWANPGVAFVRRALVCIAAAFFVVVILGALDLHGVVTLQNVYQNRIDPRTYDPGTFQSIFWNPGWFAWYFTMAFGTTVGLSCAAPNRWRRGLAAALVTSYGYFLANPQRGGFIALNFSLVAIGVIALWRSGWRPSRRVIGIGTAAAAIVAVLGVGYVVRGDGPLPSALRRFSSTDSLVAQSNSERMKVYRIAVRMWASAPLFGIGESAFSWRYREFVTNPAEADTRSTGDAHSTWLQFLATRGLVGVAAYVLLLGATARLLARAWTTSEWERRALGMGLSVAFLAFFTYSFVQAMFYMQAIQIFFWGLVAMAAIMSPDRGNAFRLKPEPTASPASAGSGFQLKPEPAASPASAGSGFQLKPEPAASPSSVGSGFSRTRPAVACALGLAAFQLWSSRALYTDAIARVAPGRPYLEQVVSTLHLRPAPTVPRDGFLGWEQEPDGTPFRWIDRTATFSVPPRTNRIEIPLRLLRRAPDAVEVSILVSGREVNTVPVDENWVRFPQMLRPGESGWTSVQLRVKGAWTPVKVGDIRIVPISGPPLEVR